jgi:hypothetical protein
MRIALFSDLLFSPVQVNNSLPRFTISPPQRFIKTLTGIWTGIGYHHDYSQNGNRRGQKDYEYALMAESIHAER